METQVRKAVGQLTLDDKVRLVAGEDVWSTHPVPRLGIPSLRVTDGPHGVRMGKTTCYPTGIGMASTWNPELVQRVGVALAEETRGKGAHILLGPCVNICRTPLNGRAFEAFGEDPYLVSRIAVAYVKGVQSQGIGTSTKHYACNNQERDRFTVDVRVDERALREIYLPAFEAAVKEADTWTVMTAHNKLNGAYCSANDRLLNQILKGEWKFRGFTVSDWGGVHDTVGAANGGQDLEMPGPGVQFDAKLRKAVEDGAVSMATLNDKATRIVRVGQLIRSFEQRNPGLKGAVDTPEHRALALEAARESIVLLKNEGDILPLDAGKLAKLAVIGPNADVARAGGGGSSLVDPFYFVTALDGIRARCGKDTEVIFERGCSLPGQIEPVPASALFTSREQDQPGLVGDYFANRDLKGPPAFQRVDAKVDFIWNESPGPGLGAEEFSARWAGVLVVPMDGTYQLGTYSDDGSRLYVNGELFVDNWGDHGPMGQSRPISLKKGDILDLRMEYYQAGGGSLARLGWITPETEIGRAADVAAKCDAAVVCVGLSNEFEGEDRDRPDLDLPGEQVRLIQAVAAANPRTIVVFIGGSPFVMDAWLGQVPAVLCAWYPGQECGHALADVLFGDANPSGKLPVTFPKRLEDVSSFGNYPGVNGREEYAEGLYVGYRHFDKRDIEPLFPFGHGLSYTRFEYGNLQIDGKALTVSFDVKNSGDRAGAEVAQVYVGDPKCSVDRPVRELKAFGKIALKPGESRAVRLQLDRRALSYYDRGRRAWVAEPGDFEVLVGSSSRDIRLQGTFAYTEP